MKIRNREVHILLRPDELDRIYGKMEEAGIRNRSAYFRKMALDGIVVKLDLPELRELTSLLRRSSNNINQIAKRANTTGSFFEEEINDMKEKQEEIWELTKKILAKLSAVR